jgi:glutamate racemase
MITMDTALLFDSGVGGLSIVEEIRLLLPQCRLTYVADNRHFPYGTLSEEALIERVTRLFPELIVRYRPDVIVIACNSASTLVLDRLRGITDTPIVGVVPAIKPAATRSRTHHIALLATPGTVQRGYTDKLIADFAQGCQVTRLGSNELVAQAERKLRNQPINLDVIAQILSPLRTSPNIDTIVLGCTHFPLLRAEIAQCLPNIDLIDSGHAIARRTQFLLQNRTRMDSISTDSVGLDKPASEASANCFLFTRDQPDIHELLPSLRIWGFQEYSIIEA